jgi:hypothetical protein
MMLGLFRCPSATLLQNARNWLFDNGYLEVGEIPSPGVDHLPGLHGIQRTPESFTEVIVLLELPGELGSPKACTCFEAMLNWKLQRPASRRIVACARHRSEAAGLLAWFDDVVV